MAGLVRSTFPLAAWVVEGLEVNPPLDGPMDNGDT
jgi:hypothetical protein